MISLIIPCFNEEDNLKKLFNKLSLLLENFPEEKIEIIIVDNGSEDGSNAFIKKHELFLKNKIRLLEIDKNIGYGDGINKGIHYSKGDVICWFHADLQFEPVDSIYIFKKYKDVLSTEEILIKGKRTNRNFFDNLFTFGMTIFTFLLFRKKIFDINAQPKLFKKSFLKFIVNPPKDFSYDIYFLLTALKNNIKIYEYPVNWHDRNAGLAKGGGSLKLKLKLTLRTIKYMITLKKIF